MEFEGSEGVNQAMQDRLDRLFAAYREACPDPEAGPDFMPALWRQIEGRRSAALSFRKCAQAFVTAAAAICLLLGILMTTSKSAISPFYDATYVEVLASDQTAGVYPDIELVSMEIGGSYQQ